VRNQRRRELAAQREQLDDRRRRVAIDGVLQPADDFDQLRMFLPELMREEGHGSWCPREKAGPSIAKVCFRETRVKVTKV
jgi:hypothetical protein